MEVTSFDAFDLSSVNAGLFFYKLNFASEIGILRLHTSSYYERLFLDTNKITRITWSDLKVEIHV